MIINKLEKATKELEKLNREDELKLNELKNKNAKWQKEFSKLMGYQARGKELEQEGKAEEAILEYEKCVEYGKSSNLFKINNYVYSIDRLVVLYRKSKKFGKEIEILRFAVAQELPIEIISKLNQRLEKCIQKTVQKED